MHWLGHGCFPANKITEQVFYSYLHFNRDSSFSSILCCFDQYYGILVQEGSFSRIIIIILTMVRMRRWTSPVHQVDILSSLADIYSRLRNKVFINGALLYAFILLWKYCSYHKERNERSSRQFGKAGCSWKQGLRRLSWIAFYFRKALYLDLFSFIVVCNHHLFGDDIKLIIKFQSKYNFKWFKVDIKL